MKYTIYKTTNLINNKIYIGCHKTKDPNDDYLGSGKHLKHSIEKYGIENFKKEVLYVFDDEASMFAKEKELVTEEFCKREDTYNICPGGQGGWGYINSNSLNLKTSKKERLKSLKKATKAFIKKMNTDVEFRKSISEKNRQTMIKKYEEGFINPFYGKKHSDETKIKISEKNSKNQNGKNNSQYGTMWITNGIENKKIKKIDNIPEGWYKGRKLDR